MWKIANMNSAAARIWLFSGVLTAVSLWPVASNADSFGSLEALGQERFILLSRNLSAASHYKGITPAEPLGVLGLDAGFEISSTEVDEQLFDEASDGSFGNSELIVPRLHVHKGLPFGLDVGASLSRVPDTDVSIIGAEIRYGLIRGGTLKPSLAVRASYSQLQGITDFDLDSSALELTISKGVLFLTPYGGAGIVRTNANPTGSLSSLRAETFEQKKLYVGLTLNLGLAITLEADRTGDFRTYSAKAGIRF